MIRRFSKTVLRLEPTPIFSLRFKTKKSKIKTDRALMETNTKMDDVEISGDSHLSRENCLRSNAEDPFREGFTINLDSDEDEVNERQTSNSKYSQILKKKEENLRKWQEISQNGKATMIKVPYPKMKIIRNRHLKDATAVFQCNAWDDVEWDEEMKTQAVETVNAHAGTKVSEEKKEELEAGADKFWNDFYENHKNKFFRDRNWLFSEFPELESPYGASVDTEEAVRKIQELRLNETYPGENSKFKVLEVGCGVGNTVFPLLSSNNNPHTYVYCCDFSTQAVDLVRQEATFDPQRCTPFVLDITDENPTTPFPEGSLDVITAIFVVSAISPAKFDQVIKNFSRFLKPGGLVLFRDYGRYDLAQLRFKTGRCIEDNFYVRGDGTRVYFFTEEEVEKLFVEQGFDKKALVVDRRLQVNRGKQLKMFRVWVQGKFLKKEND